MNWRTVLPCAASIRATVLAGVDYVDSAGLGSMAHCACTVTQAGGALRLASPTARVRQVLRTTGLDIVLDCYPTLEEACRNFNLPQPGDKGRW